MNFLASLLAPPRPIPEQVYRAVKTNDVAQVQVRRLLRGPSRATGPADALLRASLFREPSYVNVVILYHDFLLVGRASGRPSRSKHLHESIDYRACT